MSDVKRWYVSPRTIELFLRADPSGEVPAGFVGLTLLSDYDALAQRCRNLETVQQAGLERSGRIKAAAGQLGWTADREDGPLEFLIEQAQRCRGLEEERERIREAYDPQGELLRQTSNLRAEVDQLKEWQASHRANYFATAEERDSLRTENENLRAEVERLTKIVGSQVVRRFVGNDQQREIDELVALGIEQDKQEIADLKARMLEAERGNEELVRLRADARVLRIALDRIAARAEAFVEGDACMLPDSAAAILAIARKAMEAAHDEGGAE
jgi:hypothetical protein